MKRIELFNNFLREPKLYPTAPIHDSGPWFIQSLENLGDMFIYRLGIEHGRDLLDSSLVTSQYIFEEPGYTISKYEFEKIDRFFSDVFSEEERAHFINRMVDYINNI